MQTRKAPDPKQQATRATDLSGLAELVVQVLTDPFVPSITGDPELADAFDAGMRYAGSPIRCWRGSSAIKLKPGYVALRARVAARAS